MTQSTGFRVSLFLRLLVPLSILVGWGVVFLVAVRANTGQELYPPKAIENFAVAIGIGLGVFCLTHGLRQRPLNIKLALITLVSSIFIAGTCSMMSFGILLRIREAVVFRGDHLITYTTNVRVRSASMDSYRGSSHYWVEIRDYPGFFSIAGRDYMEAFGQVERTHPTDYCIRITLQRSGTAARFIANHGISLPQGSLERCPAWAR